MEKSKKLLGKYEMSQLYHHKSENVETMSGICCVDGQEVKIKKILKRFLGEAEKKIYEQEIITQFNLNHPNILESLECFQTDTAYYVIYPSSREPNLDKYLDKGKMAEKDAFEMLKQLFSGLNQIHIDKIIHRNIKPENILIFPGPCYKISDFSHIKPLAIASTKEVGTPKYNAPEIICNKTSGNIDETYDNKVDIWGLGLVYYYALTRTLPWSVQGNHPEAYYKLSEEISNFDSEKYDFKKNNLNEDSIELLKKLLHKNPYERLTYNQFIELPIYQKYKNNTTIDINKSFSKRTRYANVQMKAHRNPINSIEYYTEENVYAHSLSLQSLSMFKHKIDICNLLKDLLSSFNDVANHPSFNLYLVILSHGILAVSKKIELILKEHLDAITEKKDIFNIGEGFRVFLQEEKAKPNITNILKQLHKEAIQNMASYTQNINNNKEKVNKQQQLLLNELNTFMQNFEKNSNIQSINTHLKQQIYFFSNTAPHDFEISENPQEKKKAFEICVYLHVAANIEQLFDYSKTLNGNSISDYRGEILKYDHEQKYHEWRLTKKQYSQQNNLNTIIWHLFSKLFFHNKISLICFVIFFLLFVKQKFSQYNTKQKS